MICATRPTREERLAIVDEAFATLFYDLEVTDRVRARGGFASIPELVNAIRQELGLGPGDLLTASHHLGT